MNLIKQIQEWVRNRLRYGWYEWRIKSLHRDLFHDIDCYTEEIDKLNDKMNANTVTEDINAIIKRLENYDSKSGVNKHTH